MDKDIDNKIEGNIDHAERARLLFSQGYNCAQAVAGAFCEEMGLPLETVFKLASSFGGGMGGLRETCGAVTGMFIVAGALAGYDCPTDDEAKKKHYATIRRLAEEFTQRHDSIVCRELLAGLPGKLRQDPLPRTEEYYRVRPCVRFVETAAQLLESALKQPNDGNPVRAN